jgi:hypothetical protein
MREVHHKVTKNTKKKEEPRMNTDEHGCRDGTRTGISSVLICVHLWFLFNQPERGAES